MKAMDIFDKDRDSVSQAVAVLKEFLQREFITDSCREEPCIGCISCNAVDLERKLDALLGMF